jgi:riboflavin synthase
MFTGIVEGIGTVRRVVENDDGRRLRIETEYTDLSHGQSICVSGVCLTVEDHDEGWFEVFTATETLSKTYLGTLEVGDPVNLERALAVDDRFDGHVVQGHVDTTTTVEAIDRLGEDWAVTFALPSDHEQYVVPRGSIALDGVSLTVASVDDQARTFEVALVPTTYELTTFSGLEPGDSVHVEIDVFAKYVERMVSES